MYPPSRRTPTVLLFDIDGTLVDAGGAGRRALERAFIEVMGDCDGLTFTFAGRTDLAIIAEGLRRAGVDPRSDELADKKARVAEAYLVYLAEEVTASPGYQVFPGVVEILQEASREPSVAVGLGTGNLQPGAEIKLQRGGLNHFFAFGGFGSDHEARDELLRVGAQRGAAHLDEHLEDCRVVVIGDTPRDVTAALAIDADCVGIGTGASSPEELLSCGATCAFADLSAEGARQAILLACTELSSP